MDNGSSQKNLLLSSLQQPQSLQDSVPLLDLSKKQTTEEEVECIENMFKEMQILQFCKMPNFEIPSWLQGPRGYTCKLSQKHLFKSDLFLGGAGKFRYIVLAEVDLTEQTWDSDRQFLAEKLLKRCIPFSCSRPPSIYDQPGSGYGFSLGREGCSVGLYKTTDQDMDSNVSLDRWYLCVHTSLPEQTLREMEAHDEEIR